MGSEFDQMPRLSRWLRNALIACAGIADENDEVWRTLAPQLPEAVRDDFQTLRAERACQRIMLTESTMNRLHAILFGFDPFPTHEGAGFVDGDGI